MSGSEKNRPPEPDEIEVSVFGPGIGECIVLHLGHGEWAIFDSCLTGTGTKLPVAESYLSSMGVDLAKQVKLILATHWHDDHIKGLGSLVQTCESASFNTSGAIGAQEFTSLVSLWRNSMIESPGVKEMDCILSYLARAKRPITRATVDRTLFHRIHPDGFKAELYSISPSDKSVEKAIVAFSKLMPSQKQAKRRIHALSPNETSVAVIAKIGKHEIILGADLEISNDHRTGWTAAIDHSKIPKSGKASYFKIPHHGSTNGHSERVWNELLATQPVAVLTPYSRGRKALPDVSDQIRIKSKTGRGFITTPKTEKKASSQLIKPSIRTIKEMGVKIKYRPNFPGHVRARCKVAANDWNVELFHGATRL